MDTYQENTYGERIAGVFDDWYAEYDEASVTFLHDLARGGRVLELGIGTGRIALPLQRSGVEVYGIDASEAMVSRLRAKPGGEKPTVTLGNFADVPVEGYYSLIYVLFNTFFALLNQDEQIRCFQNVAKHLSPEGVFVIEAFVPDLTRFQGGQAVRVINIGMNEVRIDVAQLDLLSQQITSQHLGITEEGIKIFPVRLRYVWPAEFDLMARLAGMRLKN